MKWTRIQNLLAYAGLGAGALIVLYLLPQSAPEEETNNPFSDIALYVDPGAQVVRYLAEADVPDEDVASLATIAHTPQARWFNGEDQEPADRVRTYVAGASQANMLPVLVLYNIPYRDCGGHSQGGAVSGEAYRQWIDLIAQGIGEHRVVVILEPDAVSYTDCLSTHEQQERYGLLAYALDQLSQRPHAHVYIDAGNPGWLTADEVARRLFEIGVGPARGFALNVSSFYTNAENISYGVALSELLGGKQFVIDSSRNGNGATDDGSWCNPTGRALGTPPRANTTVGPLDAYLWIKPPGESDGWCNGGPTAGEWWPEYARALVENTPQ